MNPQIRNRVEGTPLFLLKTTLRGQSFMDVGYVYAPYIVQFQSMDIIEETEQTLNEDLERERKIILLNG
jgi:hypothetical protein